MVKRADSSSNPHQDEVGVRTFFDQWEIYQKVVANNYLHHCEAYAVVGGILDGIPSPFSFLDLGAGDAAWTVRVLAGRRLISYEAVDISVVAIELAKENLGAISSPKKFTQGDFFQYVRDRSGQCDVIFIGLSLHHLPLADKARFFSAVRPRLSLGGRLIFYEPVCEASETRDAVLARWWESARHWAALSAGELEKGRQHVFGNDFPESAETYNKLASAAGFRGAEVRYLDEERLYAVFECT